MNPELLLIESDHDLRNSADFLVIDKIAKAVFRVPGISRVQAITRPDGKPIEHTSIPFQISMQGTTQKMTEKYNQDLTANMLKQANDMQTTIDSMEKMSALTTQMAAVTHSMVGKMKDMTVDVAELRDHIADFDDFFRPIRNYFYWEPHCFNIPICWAFRSVFDTLDGIDTMTDDIQQPAAGHGAPGLADASDGRADARDDSDHENHENHDAEHVFDAKGHAGPDVGDAGELERHGRGLRRFDERRLVLLAAGGLRQRGIQARVEELHFAGRQVGALHHQPRGRSDDAGRHRARSTTIKQAAKEAIKGTPLEGSKIYLAGTAAVFKDMSDGNNYDLLIAAIASLCLIFIIMLIITRSVVASAVIVGTVVLSLGASFGLSVLFWQHIVGIELHWMVMAMSVIILLAVGADYNLLLVSRLKEEIHAGINTGIIRAMGGSGSVVTAAGLVFAFTMMSMSVSELIVIGQVGTTIGLGLLFDTLVVRAFMTPSIAALMGKWFWWPQRVRKRPVPAPWPKPERLQMEPAMQGVTR